MTIAAAYLVSEGVVLGADSTTTVFAKNPEGGTGVAQLLNHAQKVFEVGSESRIGLCTWGASTLGNISHRTIAARLANQIKEKTTIQAAAQLLKEMVVPIVRESGVDFVGYYIGGWEPESRSPSCFRVEVSQKEALNEPLALGLCSFSGNPFFFSRVFRGFDPQLKDNLLKELKNLGSNDDMSEELDKIYDEAFDRASTPLIAVGYQDLPIREAIDFLFSYLHITVKATKFKFGAPACGGPIEVGFITTDRNFRWVRHKNFSSAIIEQEGLYDVK